MANRFKYLDLGVQKFPQCGRLYLVQLDHLDSHHLLRLFLDASVDRGEGALPQNIIQIKIIILDLLGDGLGDCNGTGLSWSSCLGPVFGSSIDLHS